MNTSQAIAKNLKEVFLGGNWTAVNLKDSLEGVDWKLATTQMEQFNTIATLTYHMGYYVSQVMQVLNGGSLEGKDEYSFNHPPINSQVEWEALLEKTWQEVIEFTHLIAQLPESKLWEDFVDGKYGDYYRQLQGIVEHTHYHLGQVVLLKKLLQQQS